MNNNDIFHLVYVSSATHADPTNDINDILKTANEYNSGNKISGVLLFNSGIFLQLLEGNENAVKNLYTKIEKDERHKNIIKLIEVFSHSRIYPDWSMAFKHLSELDLKMVNNILSWTKIINNAPEIDHKLILKILESFKEKLKP